MYLKNEKTLQKFSMFSLRCVEDGRFAKPSHLSSSFKILKRKWSFFSSLSIEQRAVPSKEAPLSLKKSDTMAHPLLVLLLLFPSLVAAHNLSPINPNKYHCGVGLFPGSQTILKFAKTLVCWFDNDVGEEFRTVRRFSGTNKSGLLRTRRLLRAQARQDEVRR